MTEEDRKLTDLRYDLNKFYGVGRTADEMFIILRKLVTSGSSPLSITDRSVSDSNQADLANAALVKLTARVNELWALQSRPNSIIDGAVIKQIIRERPDSFSAYWLQKRDPIIYVMQVQSQIYAKDVWYFRLGGAGRDSGYERKWFTLGTQREIAAKIWHIGGEVQLSGLDGIFTTGAVTYLSNYTVNYLNTSACPRNVTLTEILPRTVEYKVHVRNIDIGQGDWAGAWSNVSDDTATFDELEVTNFMTMFGLVDAEPPHIVGVEYGLVKPIDFNLETPVTTWSNEIIDVNKVKAEALRPIQEAIMIVTILAAVLSIVSSAISGLVSPGLSSLSVAANAALASLEKTVVKVISAAGWLASQAQEQLEGMKEQINSLDTREMSAQALANTPMFRTFRNFEFDGGADDFAYRASFSAGYYPDENYVPIARHDLNRRLPDVPYSRYSVIRGEDKRVGGISVGGGGALDGTGLQPLITSTVNAPNDSGTGGVQYNEEYGEVLGTEFVPYRIEGSGTPVLAEGLRTRVGAKRWSESQLRKKTINNDAFIEVPIDITLNNPLYRQDSSGAPVPYYYNMVVVDGRVVAVYNAGGWITVDDSFVNVMSL